MATHTITFTKVITATIAACATPSFIAPASVDLAPKEVSQTPLVVRNSAHVQTWCDPKTHLCYPCDSEIFCRGGNGSLLHDVQMNKLFNDSKTFVDLPTLREASDIVAAYKLLKADELTHPINLTDFLLSNFGSYCDVVRKGETNYTRNPKFLEQLKSLPLREIANKTMDIWPSLTMNFIWRKDRGNCDGPCEDSMIPQNRTFVVAGGRFREPYYWDTFWIIEGLLRTGGGYVDLARSTIENFMDMVEKYRFVPNGARTYYLNRSQPPLLSQMIRIYVEWTGNTAIMERALPVLETEYDWWMECRNVSINNYTLNHHAVRNAFPRPESYREDFLTTSSYIYRNKMNISLPVFRNLTEEEKRQLYAEIAAAAETGLDFTARWLRKESDSMNDTSYALRTLDTSNVIGVDLNSIMYWNEKTIADFHRLYSNAPNKTDEANKWDSRAKTRREAIEKIFWNDTNFSFFDYNRTSGEQIVYTLADKTLGELDTSSHTPPGKQVWLTPNQFYPFWTGAAPDWLKQPDKLRKVYRRIADELENKLGGIASSNIRTSEQWDEPNVWPPHQYILIQGLMNVDESHKPGNVSQSDWNGDIKWIRDLAETLAQRYVDTVFCTWRATGGSLSMFPRLSLKSLEEDENLRGAMFEKYDNNSTSVSGGGGEYTIVQGFGWTNGVFLWAADVFGKSLRTPLCHRIKEAWEGKGVLNIPEEMVTKHDHDRLYHSPKEPAPPSLEE